MVTARLWCLLVDAAEVQLGGYDPATTVGEMWYTPCLSENDFIVGVTSLKFGHEYDDSVELLKFQDPDDEPLFKDRITIVRDKLHETHRTSVFKLHETHRTSVFKKRKESDCSRR